MTTVSNTFNFKTSKGFTVSQAWWYTPVIPVLRSLRQEDHSFEVGLSSLVRPCFKIKNKIGLGV